MKNKLLLSLCLFLIFCLGISGCADKQDKYIIENFIPGKSDQDTVMLNLVTYIYRTPPHARREDRFLPKHRAYYAENTSKFKFDQYFVAEDGTHYYSVLRPARNIHNNIRSAGGRFKLGNNYEIIELEEIYNTPMVPEEEAVKLGRELFTEMIKEGNVKKYIGNKEFVEFPDERCVYDVSLKDWKYIMD
ncbi:MAG: hypothetical protein ACK4ND_08910 [Cytophagaceae bacterium]